MSQADLLRLLELAHPGRPQADLLAMIEATPDRPGAKAAQKPQDGHSRRPGIYPPRKPQRPPLRPVAIERRRRLAASGPLPPSLACRFTTGELAVLRIVGDEVAEHGHCDRTLGEIAARAGVCRALAQAAIRKAAREELLTIEERPQPGRKSLPNVVRIISREWRTWIERGPGRRGDKATGYRNSAPPERKISNPVDSRSTPNGSRAVGRAGIAEAEPLKRHDPGW